MTPTLRILLADDSALVRHALSRRLRALGYEVVEADTDEDAQAVDAATITFVVMDLELGVADGTETAARIFAANPSVRVAFFTSGSSAEVLLRAKAIGPVFAKPDEFEQLIAWMRSEP
jgi:CheY-like chemotaxis protein